MVIANEPMYLVGANESGIDSNLNWVTRDPVHTLYDFTKRHAHAGANVDRFRDNLTV